jgi:hypothetical protein
MIDKPGIDCCRVSVRARTVDDVLREAGSDRVDLVKVDAESSEMHVLEGMSETLGVSRPALIVEVGDLGIPGVAESGAVVAWLQRRGYRALNSEQRDLPEHMGERRYKPGNLLFLPEKQGGDTREWGWRGVGVLNGVSLQHRG